MDATREVVVVRRLEKYDAMIVVYGCEGCPLVGEVFACVARFW